MKLLMGSRQSGKTRKLIEKAAREDGIIVCYVAQMIIMIKQRAEEMGLKIRNPITYDDLINKGIRKGVDVPFYLDDVDFFLSGLLKKIIPGVNIETISISVCNNEDTMYGEPLDFYPIKGIEL